MNVRNMKIVRKRQRKKREGKGGERKGKKKTKSVEIQVEQSMCHYEHSSSSLITAQCEVVLCCTVPLLFLQFCCYFLTYVRKYSVV
jgi:hypothetical protein